MSGRVESLVTVGSIVHAEVLVDAAGACARCRAGRGCGAGVFAGAPRRRVIRLPVPAGERVTVGADVRILIPGESLLRATLLAYGLPLAGLLAGGMVGIAIGATDAVAAVTAAAGLAAGIVAARARALRHCRYDDADALLTLEPGPP